MPAETAPPPTETPSRGRGAARAAAAVLAAAAAVYGMACVDVVLRGRSAFLEGEKWLEWSRRPELKKAHFDGLFAAREAQLRADRDRGRLDAAAFERKLALAAFERDQALRESSLKYAHVWYKTAVDLFTPPETPWTRRARARRDEARRLWEEELKARGVPYQSYMLD